MAKLSGIAHFFHNSSKFWPITSGVSVKLYATLSISNVRRFIIDSGATDYFFDNYMYFFKYEKSRYELQINTEKILSTN